ncbi:Cerato-platanin [Peniophora sp. CONT]|nr:Cerato-platanin [Peniophora sp. CONT]
MKFAATVLALVAAASTTVVKYDPVYNNPSQSLDTVACSDGSNGLLNKGFTTFSSLPSYPNIGASQYVGGWNDADCGSCWNITYQGKSTFFTAIDVATSGIVTSQTSLDKITGGHAVEYGQITASVQRVASSLCGL